MEDLYPASYLMDEDAIIRAKMEFFAEFGYLPKTEATP
jgi:hypothetical protein